ncbi:MAG: glutamate racemase [Lachnospiraceae bacterium]|nr:glutamate racemase [Lachnospiraceae bacterium]
MNNAPIGIFDSGVGGLTVAREIMRQLPNESIVYFGDMARVPYGSKSKETVISFSEQIVRFLQEKEVKAIVVACNTASAFALPDIVSDVTIPVVGVIEPGAKAADAITKNKKVGVIATEGTVRSGMYAKVIKAINPEIQVFQKACPLFVPLVEEGLLYDSITIEVADRYLHDLLSYGIDTLVLGCTHYPLIRRTIQKVAGENVSLVSPAYETAKELEKIINENNINSSLESAVHRFYVSDSADRFKKLASSILPCDIEEVGHVNIEQYG